MTIEEMIERNIKTLMEMGHSREEAIKQVAFISGQRAQQQKDLEVKDSIDALASDILGLPKKDHGINGVARQKDVVKLEKRIEALEADVIKVGDLVILDEWIKGNCLTQYKVRKVKSTPSGNTGGAE